MKKLLSITLLFVLITMLSVTMVNAATSSTLADDLYAIGSKYGMTASERLKIERYLVDYPVTESEANQILADAKEAESILVEAGVTERDQIKNLPVEKKNELKALATSAGNIVGVTLEFTSDNIIPYKDGKKLDSLNSSSLTGISPASTGNNVNVVLVVSSIAVIALATGFVVRKKFANE